MNEDLETVEYITAEQFNLHLLPEKLNISTLTLNFNINTNLKIDNIYNYLQLDKDNIIALKSRNTNNELKCLDISKEKFKSINKNNKKNFYNQLTIIIKIYENVFINAKLFKNGSVQLTGCKKIYDINIALNKLINQFKLSFKNNNNDIDYYVDNLNDLKLINIKIDLINSNFGINYTINRINLYNDLVKDNIISRLSNIHACVNIKYKIKNEEKIYVSIFVFQTGNIIIIGKKADYIIEAYFFIVRFLNKNKLNIMKKNSFFNIEYVNNFLNNISVNQN